MTNISHIFETIKLNTRNVHVSLSLWSIKTDFYPISTYLFLRLLTNNGVVKKRRGLMPAIAGALKIDRNTLYAHIRNLESIGWISVTKENIYLKSQTSISNNLGLEPCGMGEYNYRDLIEHSRLLVYGIAIGVVSKFNSVIWGKHPDNGKTGDRNSFVSKYSMGLNNLSMLLGKSTDYIHKIKKLLSKSNNIVISPRVITIGKWIDGPRGFRVPNGWAYKDGKMLKVRCSDDIIIDKTIICIRKFKSGLFVKNQNSMGIELKKYLLI